MSDETYLDLGVIKLPIGSSRGIRQSTSPVPSGQIRRTVNGGAVNLTRSIQKYQITVTGQDQAHPTLSGIFKGQQLTVSWIDTLSQYVASPTTAVTTSRTLVSGSVTAETLTGTAVTVTSASGTSVVLAANPSGAVVTYRPQTTMLVDDLSFDVDEYGAVKGWNLVLVEV